MIFQIKIYKPNGKLKKTIKAKDAEKLYWKDVIDVNVAHDRSGIKESTLHNKYCELCGKRFKSKAKNARFCKTEKCVKKRRQMEWAKRKADYLR